MEVALRTSSWSWTKAESRLREVKHLEWEELAFIIRVLYEVAHTTPMVLEVFVMASVLHQDPVCRAQREMDIVGGLDRLPTFDECPAYHMSTPSSEKFSGGDRSLLVLCIMPTLKRTNIWVIVFLKRQL
jgi:hypothetical protein